MSKKRSIHSYREPIGAREAFTYVRRSFEDTTKPEEPIGSLLGAEKIEQYRTNGVIYRQSHQAEQTKLSGAIGSRTHIDISSYVIGLVKPMYACFNIIGD